MACGIEIQESRVQTKGGQFEVRLQVFASVSTRWNKSGRLQKVQTMENKYTPLFTDETGVKRCHENNFIMYTVFFMRLSWCVFLKNLTNNELKLMSCKLYYIHLHSQWVGTRVVANNLIYKRYQTPFLKCACLWENCPIIRSASNPKSQILRVIFHP